MPAQIAALAERQAWKDLAAHYQKVCDVHLRNLFADDSKRGERMTAEAVGLFLDYSKNRITDETLKLLLQLAEESGLRYRIDAMFRGEKINVTENGPFCMWRCARREAHRLLSMARMWYLKSMRCWKDGRLLQSRAQRRMERPHRQTHSQCHQHRHWRFRPRTGDGL